MPEDKTQNNSEATLNDHEAAPEPTSRNKQRTSRFLHWLRSGIVFGFLLLFFLWLAGIFHPLAFYYLVFRPSRVYVDSDSLEYYKALDENKIERNPDERYEKIVQGTWKLESPYSRPFDGWWTGWRNTRLHLYPDGRFELVDPIQNLDYLWEDKVNTGNRTGIWLPTYSFHYGYSVTFQGVNGERSYLRYMVLWETKSNDPLKKYKLCQTLDFPTDMIGTVWVKVSEQVEKSE